MKRMTLLVKKDGMSTSDFRAHWAGPHAQLALGMDGITEYRHNRVDKVLWVRGGGNPPFQVDGIVELSFADAAVMRSAQASLIGKKYIPADEPLFLKGWTLCVVDTLGVEPNEALVKVLVPFHGVKSSKEELWSEVKKVCGSSNTRATLNWTTSTACREALWCEPYPPEGIFCFWFESVAEAHQAFELSSELCELFEIHTKNTASYLVNQLMLK